MQGVDDWATKYRNFHSGDLTHAVEGLIDVLAVLMSDGSRVETNMGSFAPKLKLEGDFTDPSQVKDDDVTLAGVEFIPPAGGGFVHQTSSSGVATLWTP